VKLAEIQPGDVVTRWLAAQIPLKMRVTEVADGVIYCGPRGVGWKFDQRTGWEIDEDLNWGPPPLRSGSFIRDEP
jgi:hypothetical protein